MPSGVRDNQGELARFRRAVQLEAVGPPRSAADTRDDRMMKSLRADTGLGPIEYALEGQGLSVLVSHGAAGGFDQGLSIAAPLASEGFRIVAPSRDGYLGSPLAPSSSPQSQADKYAALLDTIGLGSCAILGVSAGGPSAIEFAFRHPHRCRALLLVSSIVEAARPAYLGVVPEPLVLALLTSPIYRLMLLHMPDRMLLRILGVTSEDERRATSDLRMAKTLEEVLLAARDPQGLRLEGVLADITSARHLPEYPFANLQAPTLAVHGSQDRFAPLRSVVKATANMPRGEIEQIRGGDHLCIVTHSSQVFSSIVRFLRRESDQPAVRSE